MLGLEEAPIVTLPVYLILGSLGRRNICLQKKRWRNLDKLLCKCVWCHFLEASSVGILDRLDRLDRLATLSWFLQLAAVAHILTTV